MSEINPLWGDDVPVDADPAGATDGDGQPTDQTYAEEPERSYLDLEDVRDRYVRVKVDGEDVEVPLHEALAGYSRTTDYTRKTQSLAQQRQEAEYALAVQRALQAQPEMALQLLARQYGVNFASPQQAQPVDDYVEDPYADPVEQRLMQVERQNQQLAQQWQQRQADEQLRQAVGGLQQRYGLDDATTRQVVGIALQQGRGPESFDMIYKSLAFDRAQQAQAQRAAAQAQRQQAAAQASSIVGNGGSASMAGTSAAPPTGGPMSISQAFELAEKQHGSPFS